MTRTRIYPAFSRILKARLSFSINAYRPVFPGHTETGKDDRHLERWTTEVVQNQ
jgi:hypothetical protein